MFLLFVVAKNINFNVGGILSNQYTKGVYEIQNPKETQDQNETQKQLSAKAREISNIDLLIGNGEIRYYDGGEVTNGPLEGYKKIIGIVDSKGSGTSIVVTFVTTNNTDFIVNEKDRGLKIFNPSRKISFTTTELQHPGIILLDDTWSLVRQQISTQFVFIGENSQLGITVPSADLSTLEYLGKIGSEFDLYASKDDTSFVVVDKFDVAYNYSLAFTKNVAYIEDSYIEKSSDILLRISSTVISKNPELTPVILFNFYGIALPTECSKLPKTKVGANIPDDKLIPLGTIENSTVYKIADTEDEYNKEAFTIKVLSPLIENDQHFEQMNNMKRPSYEQYYSRIPIIVIKDTWNRNILLGEQDFKLAEKCN
ncbi:hypothetical protein A3K34_01780 [candidate division WWE3 bacterium RIFOXYC1_FULL_40_10]|uniref:Uncharacterized protein n=1 Tax=candidate division WWE3 bacterium RIFOXYA2_FULL_46_9 TaxID=1802636 RepID=A0A1F4W2N8_UNCKA|nr:MAG: hypothetical protein A3K58_01780 [candidate division WWE3 bacterium RIFOXYB1_FULL_40_22]OGC61593.1 MAG: hypothetical protein A3K37_01780 [candidate division WWE3 bacterium RIFOXYA1_FULL_40_11]OGC63640.1 MAG: hypothetical protein A2264_04725 [candidate division WWE3 bacterium RIFOXYA2_FULL_46_9]OGC64729.1 MAG: hypothetical protein A2326_01670 [candidate division WWE3 bacterium RIFOXYB2_FULL_41_6]OGC65976.1 MAG: hypothetical protein A3K34_01780 [candidate division WWE3 bacterium RIFOXYC1_